MTGKPARPAAVCLRPAAGGSRSGTRSQVLVQQGHSRHVGHARGRPEEDGGRKAGGDVGGRLHLHGVWRRRRPVQPQARRCYCAAPSAAVWQGLCPHHVFAVGASTQRRPRRLAKGGERSQGWRPRLALVASTVYHWRSAQRWPCQLGKGGERLWPYPRPTLSGMTSLPRRGQGPADGGGGAADDLAAAARAQVPARKQRVAPGHQEQQRDADARARPPRRQGTLG